MRRVVVTPTFAAGLGVVVAAVLAYPMRTVFSYVPPGALGPDGALCSQQACKHQAAPTGKPAPYGGAVRTAPHSPRAKADPDSGAAAPGQRPGGSPSSGQPRLNYQITGQWDGGFSGLITITFPAGTAPSAWRLRFGYPSGHILSVTPNSYLEPDGHGAVVQSADYPGSAAPGGRTFAIGVGVQGRPAPPARCSFNGQACHIGLVLAEQAGTRRRPGIGWHPHPGGRRHHPGAWHRRPAR